MAKKTKKEIDLEKSLDEFYKVSSEARKNCKAFLVWAVQKYGTKTVYNGTRVRFTLEFDMGFADENINIIYDGGNHPEYASNCSSKVYAMCVSIGEVYAIIEDSSHYEFDRIDTADLLQICSAIKDCVIPRLTEEK